MGIEMFDAGAKFIFRVYKSMGDPTGYRWSNAYEAMATEAGDQDEIEELGGRLVTFDRMMTATEFQIDAWTCATWQADSQPYNPHNFLTVPLNNVGGLRVVDLLLGLNLTFFLRRAVNTGRNGKIFLRGALGEDDVEREGQGWKLSEPSTMAALLLDAKVDSSISLHLADGQANLKLGLVGLYHGATSEEFRGITDITVGGVASLQLKRGWYNQPNRTANALARRAALAQARG